ncbi:AraC-like DNA-binding protein [Paenarthrobacter ilicis]|uniref:AraC-like DNA-binding protein n=1 Tax=Paenarthrobacter ilicis TaxID=43665 RepID=A0ABX0TLQ3_9MICC|nr:helix-turn-helix domain-containing protein [Paenarthrobacter ilicis]NIJ03432.1 AraC-like DNA-binding protein [Paenarthrobacter ilicis]
MSRKDSQNYAKRIDLSNLVGYKVFNFAFLDKSQKLGSDVIDGIRWEIESFESPVSTNVKAVLFNAFAAAHITTRPANLFWPRAEPSDQRRMIFYFVNRGAIELRGNADHISQTNEGIGVILPGKSPVYLDIKTDTEMIAFSFDTNEIMPLKVQADSFRISSKESPVIRSTYSFLAALLSSEESDDVITNLVLRDLTRDVAIALAKQSTTPETLENTAALARQIISFRFRSRTFGVLDLARELGKSRRSLERACRQAGFTVAGELRAVRTNHALRLLAAGDGRSIDTIAGESGFTTSTAMRRSFQHHYGTSPVKLREISSSQNGH